MHSPINRKTPSRMRGHRGYTLPELIVSIALAGLLLLISVRLVIAAKHLTPGQELEVGGESLAVAPSPSVLADAISLHGAFLLRVQSASAIYTFGGAHRSLPTGASRFGGKPLKAASLPDLELSKGFTLDSYGFYAKYTSKLGDVEEAPGADDFSVLTIGAVDGKLKVTGLLQVRSRSVSISDGASETSFEKREAKFFDVSGASWTYAFLEKASSAAVDYVGACHFWTRYLEGKVAEEGPAVVVCPDPSVYAGERLDRTESIPPFSRFAYVLEVSR